MYRFSIDKEDWILRFSPNIQIEQNVKQSIVASIVQMGKDLPSFSHGESFLVFNEELGALIFNIEKIPSMILTLSSIISKDRWYSQNKLIIKKYR
ncbi:hypothetical protein ACFYKX_16245 [Cytobacillus sp. FJAT-54145]|uniref:Uncharacterized protein n=1 Tax=Cytobacillus spartinae TaxID=3299023 RepID=A0ABW6KH11_9BACI